MQQGRDNEVYESMMTMHTSLTTVMERVRLKCHLLPTIQKAVLSLALFIASVAISNLALGGSAITILAQAVIFAVTAMTLEMMVQEALTPGNVNRTVSRTLLNCIKTWITKTVRSLWTRYRSLLLDHQSPLRSSPKRKQRMMQLEIERWVKLILAHYVSPWAIAVSSNQTLDKEVEGDLRRALGQLVEKVKSINVQNFAKDVMILLICHIQKLKSEARLNHFHPALACSSISVEKYLWAQTSLVLRKFKVDQTASGHLVYECLSNIISQQVTAALVDVLSEAEILRINRLKRNVFALIDGPQIGHELPQKVPYKRWKSDQDERHGDSKKKSSLERARSGDQVTIRTSKRSFEGMKKETLDLTGYSVRENKPHQNTSMRANFQTGGKISVALGGLFSATAGPLLPDNIAFKSFNKMWRSQSYDDFQSADAIKTPSPTKMSIRKPTPTSPVKNKPLLGAVLAQAHAQMNKANIQRRKFSLDYMASASKKNGQLSRIRLLQRSPSFEIDDLASLRAQMNQCGQDLSDIVKARLHSQDGSETSKEGSVYYIEQVDLQSGNPADGSMEKPSPDYEDTSDLESTIAKLRHLLSKKESGDSSSNEGDSMQASKGSAKRINHRRALLNGDSLSFDDVPPDGRLILNVSIPDLETLDVEWNQSNGNNRFDESVSLYCIHYDGIYLESTTDNMPLELGVSNFKYVKKRRIVKRRFKEFLNLQQHFESNPRLAKIVKNLKGPNKWLSLPFGKQSEQTMEHKRLFLEKWLQTLTSHPEVVQCKEMKEFLAYGDDGSESFSKQSDEKKIERFLPKAMSGMLHTIKDALPTFDDNSAYSKMHSIPALLVPSENLIITPESASMPDGSIFTRKTPKSFKIKLEFVSKNSFEGAHFENALEIFNQHHDQAIVRRKREVSMNTTNSSSLTSLDFLSFQSDLVSQMANLRLELMSDDPGDVSLADLVIELTVLLCSGPYPKLNSNVIVDITKNLFREGLGEVVDDFLRNLTSDIAWSKHLANLRKVLWDQEPHQVPDILEECSQVESSSIHSELEKLTDNLKSFGIEIEKLKPVLTWWLSYSDDANKELVLSLVDLVSYYLVEKEDESF